MVPTSAGRRGHFYFENSESLTLREQTENIDLCPPLPNHPHQSLRISKPAADQAIAAWGDAREAVKALILANSSLEAQIAELRSTVSMGYSRGRYELPRDRKDWYD